MKTINKISSFRFIKLFVHIILILLIGNTQFYAQHQHHTNTIKTDKNIYITMMDVMMENMHNMPSGNTPDTAFLNQMISHHQGALVMAEYEIAHGKNAEIIKLAKSIVINQKSEIKQMQLWLKQTKPVNAKLPKLFIEAMTNTMDAMMKSMPKETELTDIDRAFTAVMKPHHQAAIDMAKVLLQYSKNKTISAYARQLISNQQAEINKMSNFLNSK